MCFTIITHVCDKVTYTTCVCDRNELDSDTVETDSDETWHGLGKFEYSGKGLPHALFHYTEMLMRSGHHGAYCTACVESSHKKYIKHAATFSRTLASRNRTQDCMLTWVLQQKVYREVVKIAKHTTDPRAPGSGSGHTDSALDNNPASSDVDNVDDSDDDSDDDGMVKTMFEPLSYTLGWYKLMCPRNIVPAEWATTFISKRARITRMEFLSICCRKFGFECSQPNLVKLLHTLKFECFGSINTVVNHVNRKFVGISNKFTKRQDFVRIRGPPENNTCLSAQILMFVNISGFSAQSGFELPREYRNPVNNTSSVLLSLVRWMSPHPDSLIRDSKLRPLCPPPLDINHALWIFSKTTRPQLTENILQKHLSFYDTNTLYSAETIRNSERTARFDFIQPESFDSYINCTPVDQEPNTILETITIPF